MHLKDILNRFMDVDGIDAALVAGTDGLLIEGIARAEEDLETLAAVGAYGLQSIKRMSEIGGRGRAERVLVESDHGFIALTPITDFALLVVVFTREINLGYVRYLLKRYRDRLAQELSEAEKT
jgi:predicted regulator of Ras-like GTPase activity (Roadblock/LC7/MglB family)